jgi:alpha/beta superfamily hydrolase
MNSPITNPLGERLDYTFTPGAADHRRPNWIVIFGHGVTGDKDRPLMVDTAAALAAAGFDTLRVSFSGNGDSAGDFRASTITKEVADLGAVLDAVAPLYSKIAYLGHSMGAAVGVLRTAQDERISALISMAGMVDTKKFAETEFGDVTPDQGHMWDDTDCPLSSAYVTDLTETVVSAVPAAEQVAVPWLLVHGTADDVVLPEDTEHIQIIKRSFAEVRFIEGADHGFNEPDHKTAATSAVVEWLTARAL